MPVSNNAMDVERFSRLVLMIQEAAMGLIDWNEVVSALILAAGGTDGILYSPCLPPSLGGFWASRTLLANHMEHYASYYIDKDVWRMAGTQLMKIPGEVFPDEQLVDPGLVRRSEFYNDFLKPLDIGRLLCGIVYPDGDTEVPGGLHFSIFRPMKKGSFTLQHTQLIERLMPHLQLAMKTYYTLQMNKQDLAVSQSALNTVTSGVLIVNREARLIYANDTAQQIFSHLDGLTTHKGILSAMTHQSTSELQTFIARLFMSPESQSQGTQIHKIPKGSGTQYYVCFGQLLPYDSQLEITSNQPLAMLFVQDPESAFVLEPKSIVKLFELTLAEAQLAKLLVQGKSLKNAAMERGISYQTARSQLKSLFLKTGCHRQSELISILLRASESR